MLPIYPMQSTERRLQSVWSVPMAWLITQLTGGHSHQYLRLTFLLLITSQTTGKHHLPYHPHPLTLARPWVTVFVCITPKTSYNCP